MPPVLRSKQEQADDRSAHRKKKFQPRTKDSIFQNDRSTRGGMQVELFSTRWIRSDRKIQEGEAFVPAEPLCKGPLHFDHSLAITKTGNAQKSTEK